MKCLREWNKEANSSQTPPSLTLGLKTGWTVGWPAHKFRSTIMILHLEIRKCLSRVTNVPSSYLMPYSLYKHSHLAREQTKTNTQGQSKPSIWAKSPQGQTPLWELVRRRLPNSDAHQQKTHTCLDTRGPKRASKAPQSRALNVDHQGNSQWKEKTCPQNSQHLNKANNSAPPLQPRSKSQRLPLANNGCWRPVRSFGCGARDSRGEGAKPNVQKTLQRSKILRQRSLDHWNTHLTRAS